MKAKIDLRAEPSRAVVKKTEDILNFIYVSLNLPEIDLQEEGTIEIIADDEYKKIGIFILQNKKPVNKFFLIIKGESIFQYTFSETRSERTLKDASSEEFLLELWKKNKNNILDHYLKHHADLEEKYREALILYRHKDWKLAYLMHRKDYYENDYSQGTETEMYKGALECIKILKTEQKNLPLLLGEIVTPDGLKEITSRLKTGR